MKKLMMYLLVSMGLVAGCGREGLREDGERMRVVTTVGMLTDITRAVAGDAAEVRGLMGEGIDPHLFSPSAADVRRIQGADGVLYVGHMLEAKLQETFEDLRDQGRRTVAVAERLEAEVLRPDEDGNIDPHVWMDVSLWSRVAGEVRDVLAEWMPEKAEEFDANLAELEGELAELDAEVAELIGRIPEGRRVLITAHDAFGYFGARYGMDVRGIQGMSTDSEAGLRRINELVSFLVEEEIPAVFVESTLSDRNVRALVEGAKSRGHTVRVGGELYSDAMGVPGTEEGTYAGMIRHNARTIANALGGGGN